MNQNRLFLGRNVIGILLLMVFAISANADTRVINKNSLTKNAVISASCSSGQGLINSHGSMNKTKTSVESSPWSSMSEIEFNQNLLQHCAWLWQELQYSINTAFYACGNHGPSSPECIFAESVVEMNQNSWNGMENDCRPLVDGDGDPCWMHFTPCPWR